jgi:hypothetical protein
MATAAAHLSTDQVGRCGFNFMSDRYKAYQEERERFSCFMPHDTRGGMIMNRVVIILGLVVIAGSVTPNLSRAHRHILALPEDGRQSLKPAEPAEFIGPVSRSEGLSQRAEQPSWNWLSLTHTDTNYLPGSERHHPASHRSFIAPDGAALMFSWPFASVPSFWMSPQESPNERTFKQDDLR